MNRISKQTNSKLLKNPSWNNSQAVKKNATNTSVPEIPYPISSPTASQQAASPQESQPETPKNTSNSTPNKNRIKANKVMYVSH